MFRNDELTIEYPHIDVNTLWVWRISDEKDSSKTPSIEWMLFLIGVTLPSICLISLKCALLIFMHPLWYFVLICPYTPMSNEMTNHSVWVGLKVWNVVIKKVKVPASTQIFFRWLHTHTQKKVIKIGEIYPWLICFILCMCICWSIKGRNLSQESHKYPNYTLNQHFQLCSDPKNLNIICLDYC